MEIKLIKKIFSPRACIVIISTLNIILCFAAIIISNKINRDISNLSKDTIYSLFHANMEICKVSGIGSLIIIILLVQSFIYKKNEK